MQVEPASQPTGAITYPPCATGGSVAFNEERLVAEAQRESRAAFQQLVERYESRVFRVAERIAHSREDAEEIMQDAFVQAYKNLSRFRGDSRFYTWLVRITINEGLMKVRRRRFKEISIDDQTEESALVCELEDRGPNPEQRYSQAELHGILETTIAQLPSGYRSVFQLRDVEGFSIQETAQALAVSPAAVKSRLRRARLQLRESLNLYFKPRRAHRAAPGRVYPAGQRLEKSQPGIGAAGFDPGADRRVEFEGAL
jgi:RNA polymerase sigma-70 factor, ECF subfamily